MENENIDFTVIGPDCIRTSLSNNDFDFAESKIDSRFDCKVVLRDILADDSTVKSNLLKVNLEKTHSVLSQRSSERIFLDSLEKRQRVAWPPSTDEKAWTKLDHLVTNHLLQLPPTLSIQERVDNLESIVYNKASELFGFVPPPKKGLGGKNRRTRLSIELIIKKNSLLKEIDYEEDLDKKLHLLGLLENVRVRLRSLRKGEHKRKFRWKRKRCDAHFKKNPFLAAKNVLDPKCHAELSFDKESMDLHKSSVCKDLFYNVPLPPLEGLPPPPSISSPFISKKLSFSEFSRVVNSRRNGSSPGINLIPYKVYKFCSSICDFLFRLFVSCFKNCVIPVQWRIALEVCCFAFLWGILFSLTWVSLEFFFFFFLFCSHY